MDRFMKAGRVGTFQMIKHNYLIWSMKDNVNLLNGLKRRGVDDEDALPNYHYRDDALLVWNAIHNYVSTIVSGYYSEYGLSVLILRSQQIYNTQQTPKFNFMFVFVCVFQNICQSGVHFACEKNRVVNSQVL